MACAMCHPFASDTHPHEFPKWQEQMSEFATLRDMINWCIEKPNEGETIDVEGEAMKALEAYIYWSNRNSPLQRSEEHTSELQSLMRISYAVFCLKKKRQTTYN